MIKANELRIGNWVQAPLGEYMRVEQIGYKDNPDYIFARYDKGFGQNSFSGIPLTPEILEKAGFNKLGGSKFVYRIPVQEFEISVSLKLNYAYIDTQWGQASIKRPIFKYLHQLQNLYFALTGTELEINLNP